MVFCYDMGLGQQKRCHMSYKNPQPHKFVDSEGVAENKLRAGDSMGAFAGFLRRPKSISAGLVAQFFGENGNDADVISSLHLTKYLDAYAKITVWMIKDRDGKIMSKNGEYPKLTEFVAKIRRPQPSNFGQVAQFFGENGPNADAVNILNQSSYLDSLVYVEMHRALSGMSVGDIKTQEPEVNELKEQANRMTATEAQDYKKLQKRSHEALQALVLSGFFRQESVLKCLGSDEDYKNWMASQWCCHPGKTPCDNHPVQAWNIPNSRQYSAIPLCQEHSEQWNEGVAVISDGTAPLSFAQTQSIVFLQRWAQQALFEKINVPKDKIATPGAIYAWAVDNRLHGTMPAQFKVFLG